MFSLHFSSLLVTKRRKGRSDKGRQAKACGSELRTTETDAGVLVQYVEEVDEYVEEVEGVQRRQDGSFRRCSRVVMRSAG